MAYSKFALKVKRYHASDTWTRGMVADALAKGRVTELECACILRDGPRALAALGSRPPKSVLLDCADMIGVSVPDGATNPEVAMLIAAVGGGE